jgi:hypothetical protein
MDMPAPAKRKRAPRDYISARAVYTRMDGQDKKVDESIARVDLMHGALQRVEKSQAAIMEAIGKEEEDGHGGIKGTGLMGRMRRTEKEVEKMVSTYKVWIAFGSGIVTTGSLFLVAVWWLIGDKLELVLKK